VASVHFLCPHCDARLSREAGEAAQSCERCGTPSDVAAPDAIERCAACGHDQLYFQKDFNRGTGMLLIIIGAVLAPFTYFLSLLFVTILDWTIYRIVKNVVVCYQCQAVHRGYAVPPRVKPFDLVTHDRHVYGAAPPGAEEGHLDGDVGDGAEPSAEDLADDDGDDVDVEDAGRRHR
jgi:ribosomal protein S14